MMQALHIHAGPQALAHLRQQGLSPDDVRLIPAAAGGPKGLILSHLDQHIFGRWLPHASPGHRVHLVGASIGAWRMATALFPDPAEAFRRLTHGYIHQHSDPEASRKRPTAKQVSLEFGQTLKDFFGPLLPELLSHPRWDLHMITSRGRGMLRRPGRAATMAGFAGLIMANMVSRKMVGRWLERTVFSVTGQAPLHLDDQPTRQVQLTSQNFMAALQASCSIPFWLEPVLDIPGAPTGAHWDGGIIDYHFHWPYHRFDQGVVLYPHFQQQVIPGWLDKSFKRRHLATPWLDRVIVLAPNPEWVQTLPGRKLPDRHDFMDLDPHSRIQHWTRAVAESERLADEWDQWLSSGCPADRVLPL
jgi:hypothetical protein